MTRKKTHKEFVEDVYQAVGDEYTIIGQYVNSRTQVEIRHNICGNTYLVTPNGFKSGKRCAKCSRKAVASKLAKTHEQFQEELRDLVGDEYEVLSPYINANTHVQMRHNVCGHVYPVKPGNFTSGKRCPECQVKNVALKNTKTHEQYVQEVKEKVGDEYQILTPYKGVDDLIEVLHTSCGETFEVGARNFLRNPSCHHCQRGTRGLTQEEFCKRVYDLFGDEYSVIGEYKTKEHLIWMKHNVCGHKYEVLAGEVLAGGYCPNCGLSRSEKAEKAFFEALEATNGEYLLVGEYINAITHVQLRHNTCGHEYPVTPVDFRGGRRCPKCKQSRGEQQIADYLKEQGISYELQYRYDDCRNIRPLPFDFAIFDEAGNAACLIEYDGIQHFKAIKQFGGKAELRKRKQNDRIKNNYCKDNNIILIRIPYWKRDRIDNILTHWFRYYQII